MVASILHPSARITGTPLERAQRLASLGHAGQVDKLGRPYIEHCERVAARMENDDEKIVAWLHDVLEDTPITYPDLMLYFDIPVVEAVCAITHGKNESRALYYDRVKRNPIALAVKRADIADNTDPRRLLLLPVEDMTRLMRKYADALTALGFV